MHPTPTPGESREDPALLRGGKKGTLFPSKGMREASSERNWGNWLRRGLKRCKLVAALTRVRHGDDFIAGPREVKDDGSRSPSLISQMDLVREGAASAALDEGQPRHLHRASPNRGHGEIGVRVTGIERPGPVGRYQNPGDGLQRRVLAVHALLAQLPHRAVHSGVRNPPGHVEVRGPHGFGAPGTGCVRTQSQKEAPSQQPGGSAGAAATDPSPGRRPHGARSAGDPGRG